MTQFDRRPLALASIEAITPEVDRLLAGHTTVGQWSLGAICDHLARSINLTLAAPPTTAAPTRAETVAHRVFFRRNTFPDGQAIPRAEQAPDLAVDPATAADALKSAVDRLAGHPGPWPSHPVIGPMTRDEWLIFHTRHAAHHLGFAWPT